MAKIFITGSADGLGQLAAKELIKQGHDVVLHARNEKRGEDALQQVPGAKDVLITDLANMNAIKELAVKANALGTFDAVIHNAGVYQVPSSQLLTVNTLAPYVLTGLMHQPKRLIYLSSGMHTGGHFKPDFKTVNYSDTKLHIVLLAKAVARLWPDVQSNAVDPGWVPTKMGGAGAPDDLRQGYETQVWLATHDGPSGKYFFHRQEKRNNPEADDTNLQDRFLATCAELTGIKFN